jgi:4-alpha-glucanotransferase
MPFQRASGILLHPTSLPSRFGIGDLGQAAYEFIDFLDSSGQKLWQILPLGPTGFGNSPYMSYSAIAGNPLLVSPDALKEQGWLTEDDFTLELPTDFVDFDRVIAYKNKLFKTAYENFRRSTHDDFEKFCQTEASWLDDYAMFMALSEINHGTAWNTWEPAIAKRDPKALAEIAKNQEYRVTFQKFLQFQFFTQWSNLKDYANSKNIQIIGDIPIYVAHNSADVWTRPENFKLDPEMLEPAQMAGVPPDYFSKTGQLWGNPVYDWDVLEKTNFAWWIDRFKSMLKSVDIVRIDHFRGFEAFWQVAAGEETAMRGKWVKAPGIKLFETLKHKLGSLPILAEDLGMITPEVEALLKQFEFPGMRVLLFGFGGDSSNNYLPHNYVTNSLVYTGTHDNDTSLGWWLKASKHEKQFLSAYLDYPSGKLVSSDEISWKLIRMALSSVSDLAIIPLQDVLGLDNSARMNRPGTVIGNWSWRYESSEVLTTELSQQLLQMTQLFGR